MLESDEFYTRYSDIEAELQHYWQHLKGKTIYCNCDDPDQSKFWQYFISNAEAIGFEKIIFTHYNQGNQVLATLWTAATGVYFYELDGEAPGDFRSPDCRALLREADVVITNPPFSLFQNFMKQVDTYNKKFLVIGNINAVTQPTLFRMIKDNEAWVGINENMVFRVRDSYTSKSKRLTRDEKGTQWMSLGNTVWFTNMQNGVHGRFIPLTCTYDPEKYPFYDNYHAIEVSRYKDIPKDYFGEMGVPITYLRKHNPHDFNINGLCRFMLQGETPSALMINGKKKYRRVIIQRARKI